MKKILLLLVFVVASMTSKAQFFPNGTPVSGTFTITDINNISYNLFNMTDSGKHVIINLSGAADMPSWTYRQTGVLKHYYNKYGPLGTEPQKDARVILYEVDQNSTLQNLMGLGANTLGDWISGTPYPICNPDVIAGNVIDKFVIPGQAYPIPAVFVVCKNKKLYKISTGISQESALRDYIQSVCGIPPLSTTEIIDLNFIYDIYPNPTNDKTFIHLNLQTNNIVSYLIKSPTNKVVSSLSKQNFNRGSNTIEINTLDIPNGTYFLKLQVGNREINTRIIVQH